MIQANNPALTSWVDVPADSDFPIQNLPFGIFSTADRSARAGVAIGAHILDLRAVAERGLLDGCGAEREDFSGATLNAFIDRGKQVTRAVRGRVSELLREGSELAAEAAAVLVAQSDATMHLPCAIGDYTDFYSSEDHARNVGKMFRDPDNALLPNWKHIPVGYHGRASSIVVSGTPIKRPHGQTRPDDSAPPVFGPSRQNPHLCGCAAKKQIPIISLTRHARHHCKKPPGFEAGTERERQPVPRGRTFWAFPPQIGEIRQKIVDSAGRIG